MMQRLLPYVLVGLGGLVGANVRFLVARAAASVVDARFPLGTFLINVSGSFLLGALSAFVAQKALPHADAWRLLLGVGFLGAYTTFSTFEFETHALLEDAAWLLAAANMLLSLFVGLLAVRLGIVAARSWLA